MNYYYLLVNNINVVDDDNIQFYNCVDIGAIEEPLLREYLQHYQDKYPGSFVIPIKRTKFFNIDNLIII